MRHVLLVLAIFVASCFTTQILAATDRAIVMRNVDEIVAMLDSGKHFSSAPQTGHNHYSFIMDQKGTMLSHPSLIGQDLREKALPTYVALLDATPEGMWLTYQWEGKKKRTYAKLTKRNLIVGSGY